MFKNKKLIILFAVLVLIIVCVQVFWLSSYKNIKGIQIITNHGSIILGQNKYSKKVSTLVSPNIVYFDKESNAILFQTAESDSIYSKSLSRPTRNLSRKYSIRHRHNDLLINNQSAYSFAPLSNNKMLSPAILNTLKTACQDNTEKDNPQCHWSINNNLNLYAINSQYACLDITTEAQLDSPITITNHQLVNYDYQHQKISDLSAILNNPTNKLIIYKRLIKNIYLDIYSTDEDVDFDDIEIDNSSIDSLENKIKRLLSNKGYTLNFNNLCLSIKPTGLYLVMAFQNNYLAEPVYYSDILLKQVELPKQLTRIVNQYNYNYTNGLTVNTSLSSPGDEWTVDYNYSGLIISNQNKEYKLKYTDLFHDYTNTKVLGIFWIYKSPNINKLTKYEYEAI